MVEIKSTENASRESDLDPTTYVLMRFITHATWLHLTRRSAIQPPRLNSKDSHSMRFIKAIYRGLNRDWTVTLKFPYKLRCYSRL